MIDRRILLATAAGLSGLVLVTTVLMLAQFVSAPPVGFIGVTASPPVAQSASVAAVPASRSL